MINLINILVVRFAQLVDDPGTKLPNQNITEGNLQTTIVNVLNVVFGTLGAIAVIVIVVAGLQYILSSGDPSKTAKAKNTILYALIGLVVALMSGAIVNFVLKKAFNV